MLMMVMTSIIQTVRVITKMGIIVSFLMHQRRRQFAVTLPVSE
jgi:hypothetical protein